MADQTEKVEDQFRLKYDSRTALEEASLAAGLQRDEPIDVRATYYQTPISTLPLNPSDQRDVVDFSFTRKDLPVLAGNSQELRDQLKEDRLITETFRALTAGGIGSVGANYWSSRATAGLETTQQPPPAFPSGKAQPECYNPSITLPQKELLNAAESFAIAEPVVTMPETYARHTKPDDRLYSNVPAQPIESFSNILPTSHRSQDVMSEMYRSLLSGYRFPAYQPTYETTQSITIKPHSPALDIPAKVSSELDLSVFHAARDREQSNLELENANALKHTFHSEHQVGDIHGDKTRKHFALDASARLQSLQPDTSQSVTMQNDFHADRLRELAETVVYSQSLGVQPSYEENVNKVNAPPPSAPEQAREPAFTCVCMEDLYEHEQQSKKKYTCGACLNKFVTVCQLHEHQKEHGSGGSYHYDHVSNTAYPRFDTFCSFAQTDLSMHRPDEELIADMPDTSDLSFSENDLADLNKKAALNVNDKEEVIVKNELSEVVQSDETSANTSTEVPNKKNSKKGRKRKQDCPKPSKVRRLEGERKTRSTRRINLNLKTAMEDSDDDLEVTEKPGDDPDYVCEDEKVSGGENSDTYEVKSVNTKIIVKPIKKRKALRKSTIVYNDKKPDAKIQGSKQKSDEENLENGKETITKREKGRKAKKLTGVLKKLPSEKKGGGVLNECHLCKTMVPKRLMRRHMQSHDAPFICEVCGKTFAKPRFLKKHQVVHAEVKPWKCSLCGQQFCQKTEYKIHMAGHDDYRPFQCNVCQMRFLSKTTMRTHQANIHMGVTKFECEVCNRRFFKKSSLTVHLATHYEAQLQCQYCERKFRDKTGLKRHERIHTGVKKYKCHICEHAFIQSTPFWVHMEKRHNMDRATVKAKLKEIHEANRRSGIRTEIQSLPRTSVAASENSSLQQVKSENQNSAMFSDSEGNDSVVKTVKSNAGVKFPVLSSGTNVSTEKRAEFGASSEASTVGTSQNDSGSFVASEILNRLYEQTTQGEVRNLSSQPSFLSPVVPPNFGNNVVLPGLAVPPGNPPLALIGQNTAQPTSNSVLVPMSGSYTNISTEHVKTEL